MGERQRHVGAGGEDGLAAGQLGQDLGGEKRQGQPAEPAFERPPMAGEVEREGGEKGRVETGKPAVGLEIRMEQDDSETDGERGAGEQHPQPAGREKHGQREEDQQVPEQVVRAPMGQVAGRDAPRLAPEEARTQLERGARRRRPINGAAEESEKKRGGEPPRDLYFHDGRRQ